MGIFVHLNINFDNITESQWENTYKHTLTILKKSPIPLMSIRFEENLGEKGFLSQIILFIKKILRMNFGILLEI
ncbi:MAG: hypothetical protein K8S23_02570 [Candidatus Cloacimonetes bacterium]|nr:hypothetical protein [Candidatus Cloacimonadota bacterium]